MAGPVAKAPPFYDETPLGVEEKFEAQPQPEDEAVPEAELAPEIAAGWKAEEEAEPQPEPQAGRPITVSFSRDEPIEDPEPALLSADASFDNARAFAARRCWKAGSLGVYFWRGKFWEWNGRVYREVPEADLRARVYDFLDGSRKREKVGDGLSGRFRPTQGHVNGLLDGLQAGLTLPSDCDPPTWLDTGRHAGKVVMFKNGMLDVTTRVLAEPTPKLWIQGEAGYEWDPHAKCPGWDAFMESSLPGDWEAKLCVEEGLGLSMTEDLSFQIGMMLVGKPRGGTNISNENFAAMLDRAIARSRAPQLELKAEPDREA